MVAEGSCEGGVAVKALSSILRLSFAMLKCVYSPMTISVYRSRAVLQYLLLGAGEGRLLTQGKEQKVVQAKREFDVFTREPKKIVRRRQSIFQRRNGMF